jgi:hypothetical protein
VTAARTAYLAIGALLLIAVVTVVAVMLGVDGDSPLDGIDLTICRTGEPVGTCYPRTA